MNASNYDSREAATKRYLSEGLGARLTQNSEILISEISLGLLGELQGLGIKFVCGNIAERALWLAYGVWIGYFSPVPPISETEQRFVAEYSSRLSYVGMPAEMEQLCVKLAHFDLTESASFYAENFPFFPLARPMPEWFPVFQAVLIIQEMLNEPAITPFFLFMQQGGPQTFRDRSARPADVFSRLLEDDYARVFSEDFAEPERVIAGFIRFTEFLSAMDGIFPTVDTRNIHDTQDGIPDSIVDRYILSSYLGQYRWRLPVNEFEKYQDVIRAFSTLANNEFARHPSMGISWSFSDTYMEIMQLTFRFFSQPDGDNVRPENDPQGIEDPEEIEEQKRRVNAIQRRVRVLGGDTDLLTR